MRIQRKSIWNLKFYLKHFPTEGTFTTDQDPCKFSEASGGHITSSNGKCAPIPNCYVALQIKYFVSITNQSFKSMSFTSVPSIPDMSVADGLFL